ncbi:hypothetical protein A3A91_01135 [Candidatus Nomurabacteria bacterium RIFCSPLOWO2_01_FULL_36_16]|uniref:Uncharacterized protein n=1 Tax=Candidatus Nomurabacteria bacterium RIFCSPLOWO2_01_FULL_36_16 TaxID=1801767 RepID=A0A1F6WY32_9BACT|nr:MAG: hypothetical protein A3A91_01135 [Candidatus Nomurabacteria bacterium RIFCSPLOWO2_01_FULL_36_16]
MAKKTETCKHAMTTVVVGKDINLKEDWGVVIPGEYCLHCEKLLIGATPKPPDPPLDFLILVDRVVKPTSYPAWFRKLEHPELECSGPVEYDLQTDVEQWLHHDQKRGGMVGNNTIYDRLKKDNAIGTCLNLQDGLAIQAKGIAVFRKLFAGKEVFLWGSVVQDRRGGLHVPYLHERGGEVVVGWSWIADHGYFPGSPALRFK